MDSSEDEYAVDDPSVPSTSNSEQGTKRKAGQSQQGSSQKVLKVFQEKWLKDPEFKGWLQSIPDCNTSAKCVCCNQTLNCGKSDLQKHAKTEKHKKRVKSIVGVKPITQTFFGARHNAEKAHEENVKKMELQLASFFAEHNLAFLCSEHLVKCIQKGAKDSAIVKDLRLGRQKCTAIVKNIIAKTETEQLVDDLKQTVFSVMVDESTDISNKKNMCILVRYVSQTMQLQTRLLEIVELDAHDCSAAALWAAFEKCLQNLGVPVENIVGLACDNAAVMTGRKDSFWTRLKSACPWAVLLPCICHSAAIVMRNACSTLPSFVENLLRSVSTYMNTSPKRSAELKDFQELYEEELNKILRPSTTRWLVLHSCVVRFLACYQSLVGFFRTTARESPKDKEASIILQDMLNPYTKGYMLFLEYVLGHLNEFNAHFQTKGVLVHTLSGFSRKLLRKFAQNFIDPRELGKLHSINFSHPSNHVPLNTMYLGPACKTFLENIPEGKDKVKNETDFRLKCRDFYVKAAQEMQARLPFNQTLFQEMRFVDPKILLSPNVRVETNGLPDLSSLTSNFQEKLSLDANALSVEWRTIPIEIEGDLRAKILQMETTDAWAEINTLQNFSGNKMFPQLCKLATCVMSLPHSNADAERAFSIVTDVKTKNRNRMGCDTLNAIAVVRTSFADKKIDCFSFDVTKDHLEKFNQAIYKTTD